MPVQLEKDSIDLGIVARNGPDMVAFYRDVLGFVEEPQTPFPGGGVMYRLRCGTSLIKVVVPEPMPDEAAPAGAIASATGYRYWTMTVSNLQEIVSAGDLGVFRQTQIRAGVSIAIVADPDGNLVEFLELSDG